MHIYIGLKLEPSCPPPLQVMLGAVVNGIGNLIYAFTVLADGWWIMLLGRRVCWFVCARIGQAGSLLERDCQNAAALGPPLLSSRRLVAGVGAATLGIGSSYITQTTTSERRQVCRGSCT